MYRSLALVALVIAVLLPVSSIDLAAQSRGGHFGGGGMVRSGQAPAAAPHPAPAVRPPVGTPAVRAPRAPIGNFRNPGLHGSRSVIVTQPFGLYPYPSYSYSPFYSPYDSAPYAAEPVYSEPEYQSPAA